MKRDMDLVRCILLAIEASDETTIDAAFESFSCSEAVLQYHLGLLYQAGFIDAHDFSAADAVSYTPTGLTWQGHEFLDNIRNESLWKKVKESVRERADTVSLAVMQDLAKSLARSAFDLSG